MDSLTLDKPMIDWVTITSWDVTTAVTWSRLLNVLEPTAETKPGRIRGYEGVYRGGGFIGQAAQAGRAHMMLRIAGATADQVSSVPATAHCTRLDVQITTAIPDGYSARRLADDLRKYQDDRWQKQVTLVEGSDGLDTVYVGSRQSERYARIYVKQVEEIRYLRLEVEHKGTAAQLLIENGVLLSTNAKGGALIEWIDGLQLTETIDIIEMYRSLLDCTALGMVMPKVVRTMDKTMMWILNQVTPAMVRLLQDHDYGTYLRHHLIELLDKHKIRED